ncbi:hypothetical protein ETU08_06535 [Apibacter muscae]|uniref:hypothetical protein n=1 Tax=Apibacter muscae TaxID=2509004 RepID=UPI0011ADCB7C|nr:hypothetical protein [Apibacter muscae]TWP30211.1 hypothetical protein ETU08_06535 [Apibacter muscae]
MILKELQENKDYQTKIADNYYNHLLESLNPDQEQLSRRLIHHITLLNKTFREKHNQEYQSTHEDIILALELVQDLIKPQSKLTPKEQSRVEELEQHYLSQGFTRQEVQKTLQISKSQTHRFLTKLEQLNLIQKESAPKNQTHRYSFGIDNPDIAELFSDNQNIEFTDII